MKKFVTFLLGFFVVACGTLTQEQVSPPETTAVFTEAPILKNASSPVHAILDRYDKRHLLQPVDLRTGQMVAESEPISAGSANYQYAFSPDGQTLAIVSTIGQLHLIDVLRWQDMATDLHFWGVTGITFSPDGSQLALTYGSPDESLLALVDVATQTKTAETGLDFHPHWQQLYFTPDGEQLVLYGLTRRQLPNGPRIDTGPVRVGMFQVADLSPAWDVSLPQVLAGNQCEPGCDAPEHDILFWSPAVVMAPDGRFLHIIHAHEDRFTTLDLVEHYVTSKPIRPTLSWLDRLIAATADVAHAKAGDGAFKEAAISADGNRLYVTGWTMETSVDEEDNYTVTETPLGLKAVDATTGTMLEMVETTAKSFAVLPNRAPAGGDLILLHGWYQGENPKPWTELWDIDQQRLINRLDGYIVDPVRTLNGRLALVANQPGTEETTFALVDPASLNIITSWPATHHYVNLIAP